MEESQDKRVINYKDMSCESILAHGEAQSKTLKTLSMRPGQKKKNLESLGETDYDSQPSRCVKDWNPSKRAGQRVSMNANNQSASSDEMNLKSGDDAIDFHPTRSIPSSSVIDSQSSSSRSSSSFYEKRSQHRGKGKAVPVPASRPSILRYGHEKVPTGLQTKGKARKQESRAQARNLPTGKANHVRPRAPGKKVKNLPLLKDHVDNGRKDFVKRSISSKHTPFPMDTSTSLSELDDTIQTNGRSPGSDAGSRDEESDDPLRSNENDEIVNRGGLRPFPMSSQDRGGSCSNKPPSSSSLASTSKRESETDEEANAVKRRRRSSVINDISLVDVSFDELDLSSRKEDLCPYCDMPLPANPSPSLQRMLNGITSYRPDPRPSNPNGRKAPLLSYINMCQRHQFEVELLPQAEAAGWPTRIDFNDLPSRIGKMRKKLKLFIGDRSKSLFWVDAEKQLGGGTRKASSIAGQLSAFEKCQPGYYGEQGFVIMYRTLSSIFPPETMDPKLIEPLSSSDFIQRVLVPECALALIKEDSESGTTTKDAFRIMQASSKFGSAMYPDMDTSGGAKDVSANSSGHGVGEAMLKDQARKNASNVRAEQARLGQSVPKAKSHDEKPSRIHKRSPSSSKAAEKPRSHDARQLIEPDSGEEPTEEAVQRRQRTHAKKEVKSKSNIVSSTDNTDEDDRDPSQQRPSSKSKGKDWLLDSD